MTDSIFEVPELFGVVGASREAIASLHLGEVVLLGRLDDDDLSSIGLTAADVLRSILSSYVFTVPERLAVEEAWNLVRAGSTSWIAIFEKFLVGDEGWRDFVSLHWCLRNPYFDEAHLASGPLGTLANTMLEVARLEATVTDVHGSYASFAEDIASGKLSGTEEGLVVAGNVVVGGVVGFLTMGSGAPAVMKASSWLDGKLRVVDGWVLDLALECVVAATAEQLRPEIHQAVVRKIFDEARGLAGRPSGSGSDQQQRMLLNAYRGLTSDTPLEEHASGAPLPNFDGQTIKQVKRYLEASGLAAPHLVDVGQPDEGRWIMSDGGWGARGQIPLAGVAVAPGDASVIIGFSRPGETVRPAMMKRQLEEAQKHIRG